LAAFVLGVGAWSTPVAALCLALYWPLVSLWGTMVYVSVELYGTNAWVSDTTPTRAMIGAGLILCYSLACLAIARRLLNAMVAKGELGGIDEGPQGGACLECGYCAHLPLDLCPECGSQLQTHRRVLFIWPRFLGTPTRIKRRRGRIGLGLLICGLLLGPLLIGVTRVVLGSL